MIQTSTLKTIGSLQGVAQFVVADPQGKIIAGNAEQPTRFAKTVGICGKKFAAMGKTGFKYAVFDRKNNCHLFIFPVGKYYLGVVKEQKIKSKILYESIIKFLADLEQTER